ncbi:MULTISPECIES: fibrobacter succinogenes major paralogous domain-containing protein [unclassified Fibrobacter]|uniref:fibrobacter succinogenes major paralogous domain-containing protein n=1 Tax=unclassified Fibrobacter TaxID=2634177 RepID=UPI000917D801|nr:MULTISPECIES: fibrobacter succinogenes major paralogous domain-containing protein [unclassified Fibrobacter]OWV08246.1 hypothetical protein B7993_01035 [Fibrobacter sp. UWH3]SHL20279.1 major paralogous domain-containing protein [Fibrobacter sp. UWH6]
MMKVFFLKRSVVPLAALIFALAACSEGPSSPAKESSHNNEDENSVREVATVYDLGRCTREREGDTVYVIEKLRDYVCINHAWIDASEDLAIKSSSSKKESYSSMNEEFSDKNSSSSIKSGAQDTTHSSSSKQNSLENTPSSSGKQDLAEASSSSMQPSSSSKAIPSSSATLSSPSTVSSSSVQPQSSSHESSSSYSSSSTEIEESSSSETQSSELTHREVSDVYGIGACSIDNDGHTVFVTANAVTYVCEDGVWSIYVTSPSITGSSSSVDQASIPSYTEITDILQLSKCNEDSEGATTLSLKDTTYYTCTNGVWQKGDIHGYIVKKRSILGKAHKGPFQFGSTVYLRELAGDELRYTGKVYVDEISSNKGDYVIPSVNLIYPYVSIEVTGLYRNEVSGEYSQKPLTLYALTDLSVDNRTKVNVNLLTHLEYKRALHLVRKGYSILAAKKQADQEIMTAFELPTTIKYSEDLSIFEDNEEDNVDYANASLMMLNLLFLGNRNDDEIESTIETFVSDFEKDGVWDDASTKAAMADFAIDVNSSEILANVKDWNILDIPAFETQLEMFWNNVYKLGGCTAVRKGVVSQNKNELSKNYNVYYVCKDSRWVKASQIEYDTYGWTAGKIGEVKKGDVSDTKYVYRDGSWSTASSVESTLGSCTTANSSTISQYTPPHETNSYYYVCANTYWVCISTYTADTYGWSNGELNEVRKGNVTEQKYIYKDNKWKEANEQERSLGSCIKDTYNTIGVHDGEYYICKESVCEIYSQCTYNVWVKPTDSEIIEQDTRNTPCTQDGSIISGQLYSENKYVCDNGSFRFALETEIKINAGCNSYTIDNTISIDVDDWHQEIYKCTEATGWKISGLNYINHTMTDPRDGQVYKTTKIGNQIWMAENLNYAYNTPTETLDSSSFCYDNDAENCKKYGRLYLWSAAMDSSAIFSLDGLGCGDGAECNSKGEIQGVCPEGWHLPSLTDIETLYINSYEIFGDTAQVDTASDGSIRVAMAGYVLKSSDEWIRGGGKDYFKFSAKPAGCVYFETDRRRHEGEGIFAPFWTSTNARNYSVYAWGFESNANNGLAHLAPKYAGYSVRCLTTIE